MVEAQVATGEGMSSGPAAPSASVTARTAGEPLPWPRWAASAAGLSADFSRERRRLANGVPLAAFAGAAFLAWARPRRPVSGVAATIAVW